MLPDTTGICFGDSAIIELKQNLEKNATTEWSAKSIGIIYNTKKIKVKSLNEKYYIKVVSGKNIYLDSTVVKMYSKPKSFLRDTVLCKNKPLVLDAKNPGLLFFWSTGETTQKIKVESSGSYWVKITNLGCTIIDTSKVKFLPAAISGINSETTFCLSDENKILTVKPSNGTKVLWNTGSTSPSITINNEGNYWVKSVNKTCGEQTDTIKVKLKACDCEMIIPNSFTPNEDNRNDYFFPVLQCEYTYFKITISDRWENTVYTSNNVNGKWDGRFKGNLCPEETYVFVIESIEKGSDKKLLRKGKITLFR
ncbi:MAG: gliding motility-associated C-terminal domain-containing protein [Bacteroidota bacterium]|nr:gliding motility-associated C-terminal domain-containing protein [Bacteroidota bacterium]MDP3144305.1 gliding motility-associated C-terminal domain-containing protein [Bacteroidota bacterium]